MLNWGILKIAPTTFLAPFIIADWSLFCQWVEVLWYTAFVRRRMFLNVLLMTAQKVFDTARRMCYCTENIVY